MSRKFADMFTEQASRQRGLRDTFSKLCKVYKLFYMVCDFVINCASSHFPLCLLLSLNTIDFKNKNAIKVIALNELFYLSLLESIVRAYKLIKTPMFNQIYHTGGLMGRLISSSKSYFN